MTDDSPTAVKLTVHVTSRANRTRSFTSVPPQGMKRPPKLRFSLQGATIRMDPGVEDRTARAKARITPAVVAHNFAKQMVQRQSLAVSEGEKPLQGRS